MPEPTRTRTRLSAGDRREQILDIAHAIVDAEGFHAATFGRIAADAGVTRTVLYHQFGDLAGLYVALVDREAARAGELFAEATRSARPTERSGAFGDAFIGFLDAVDAHPATWRLFLFPPQGAPPELHERLAEAQAVVRRYLAQVLTELNPELPDPELTAHVLHAAGRELLQLRLTRPELATHERILAQVRRLTPAQVRKVR